MRMKKESGKTLREITRAKKIQKKLMTDEERLIYNLKWDIKLWGSIYPAHFAIPYLKSSYGKIIINASSAELFQPPNGRFYNANRSALISFYEDFDYCTSSSMHRFVNQVFSCCLRKTSWENDDDSLVVEADESEKYLWSRVTTDASRPTVQGMYQEQRLIPKGNCRLSTLEMWLQPWREFYHAGQLVYLRVCIAVKNVERLLNGDDYSVTVFF